MMAVKQIEELKFVKWTSDGQSFTGGNKLKILTRL
jgi:hypothetical protein